MHDKTPDMPRIAAYKPHYCELEAGKSYLWCSCGLSRNQPFCDQSHQGTGFKPVRYIAASDGEEVLFCNCKHSGDKPFCDGAHNNLRDTYDEDDPHSEHNRGIRAISCDESGRAVLDGGCYVCKVDRVPLSDHGTLRLGSLISAETGAQHQSQFYAEAGVGVSPVIAFGDSHVVILVAAGLGRIDISGEAFDLSPEMGVYVQPGEAFAVSNEETSAIKLFISVCPHSAAPELLPSMPDNFDHDYPLRTVGIDPDNRQAMGDRFFQVLVDERIGSSVVTQFIGEVPLSKAAPHRHLYEESIVVLRGQGCMWTEGLKTPVAAGDVIFLPRKQVHSLQCTDPGGMLLAGVIYPGNNPSINY
jgi:CDGSH-type Zn-finger protein/quercetin dioxygenase-like cupin family protein